MESRFEIINKLFGGYSENQVFSMYGMPSVGKTLFLLHETQHFLEKGYKVIYIDTEGGVEDIINAWKKKLKLDGVSIIVKRTIRSLFHYLGEDIDFSVSKKGKLTLMWKGLVKKSDDDVIWNDVRRAKKYVVILDSLTSPISNEIPSSTENYPFRSDVIGHVFGMLYYILDSKNGGFAIMTHHGSLNPTNPYTNIAEMKGGSRVKFMSKKIAYFEKPRKNIWQNIRKIHAVRTPLAKDWHLYGFIEYTDDGIRDVDEDYVMSLGGK